jgi:hypothetical protein
MLVLGVDIAARKGGSNCGLALIDASKIVALDQPSDDLLWTCSIDGTDLAAIVQVVTAARDQGATLVLEEQFISVDPSAVEKLIGTRVRFETVAQIRGVPFVRCNPATWQVILKLLGADCPMKVSKPRKPKRTRAQKAAPAQQVLVAAPKMVRDTKAAARMLCSRLYPSAELTKDECDAVLMARQKGWSLLHV